jgi:mono/diheme cytochrome c family protein
MRLARTEDSVMIDTGLPQTVKPFARFAAALAVVGVVTALPVDAQVARQGTPPIVLDSIIGGDSFLFYCAPCHGSAAKGDGPVASALTTRPTDLTSLARRNGGTFPRDRVRMTLMWTGRPVPAHGSREMPIWGVVFRALDSSESRVRLRIDGLVAYLEALQEPASAPEGLGARLFKIYCATCHGTTARGNGPLADQLRRQPPDLTSYTVRNGGVFPSSRVYEIIDGRGVRGHGDREMPVWGDAFRSTADGLASETARSRIDAIVEYLRAIQQREAE